MITFITSSTTGDAALPLVTVTGSAAAAVHTAAGLITALFAMNAFGRRRGSVRRSAVLLVALLALAALGAVWDVQSGAGIALAGFITAIPGKLPKVRGRLLVNTSAIVLFAALGAGWVLIPFFVFVVLRAMGLLSSGSGSGCGARRQDSGAGHGRRTRPVNLRKHPQVPVPPAPAPGPVPASNAEPDIGVYLYDERLPPQARDRVRLISDRARATGDYLAQQGRSSGVDALEVERIRNDYAPGAIRGYLALPPWSANDAVLSDGKTGAQLLTGQLDLLADRLRQVQDRVARSGGQELLTHGRFLDDRFPTGNDNDLRL